MTRRLTLFASVIAATLTPVPAQAQGEALMPREKPSTAQGYAGAEPVPDLAEAITASGTATSPSASKAGAARPPQPRQPLSMLIFPPDYPDAARQRGEQGTVDFNLTVAPSGRVSSCTITGSSGSSVLDVSTCRLLSRRARFDPATDEAGRPIEATLSSSYRWTLSGS